MPGTKRKGKGDAWYFEVTIGTDFSGKPIRYNRTFRGTEKQAEKALARFYTECEDGKINKGTTMTIYDLASLYVDEYVSKHLKISNIKNVRPSLHKYILPLLGRKKVTKITRLEVQQWVNILIEKGELSSKTITNHYSTLSGMMKFAVRMGIIERSPCHDINLPKIQKKEAHYYTKEQVGQLLAALENIPDNELRYKAIVYIALFGGLRNGEIIGLNWEDLDGSTVSIKRTRYIKKGGIYEDTPKTLKSTRTVSLPQNAIDVLGELKIQQMERQLLLGDKWINTPAMFKNDFGDVLYPNLPAKWLKVFLEKNSLPHITMHGLRHTHTSLLAYLNTNKLDISRRLGHSQLSTTLNIYTHIFEESDKQIANDLNIFTENLRKAKKKNG